jgi:hypothetical protein
VKTTHFLISFPLWSSFSKEKKLEAFTKILISYAVNIREDEDGLKGGFSWGWGG